MNILYTMRKQIKVEYAMTVLIKLNLSQKHVENELIIVKETVW